MHVSDKTQILLVTARFAYRQAPLLDGLEDLSLDTRGPDRRPLGKPANEFIEKFLCTDLQVERVAAVLDTDIEKAECEESDIGVAVVNERDNGSGCLTRSSTLLGIDKVCDLEVQGEVRLVVLGATGSLNEALELGRGTAAELGPAIAGGRPGRSRLHDQEECRGEGRRGCRAAGDEAVASFEPEVNNRRKL